MSSLEWSISRNTGASVKKEISVGFFFTVWFIFNLYANIKYKIGFVDKMHLYINLTFFLQVFLFYFFVV